MRVVVVTGTDTGVGKTVVTAALARAYTDAGGRVVVVKPTQTGVLPGEPADLAEITRLSGVAETHEHVRLRDPLAPDAAARRQGVRLPRVAEHADRIAGLAAGSSGTLLIEGAGGLLVRMDEAGRTLADLARELQERTLAVTTVVVTRADLGTLNHTALTAEALRARGIASAGLVVGAWPTRPDLAAHSNLVDLPAVSGLPLLGRLPLGAGGLDADAFAAGVPEWFSALP